MQNLKRVGFICIGTVALTFGAEAASVYTTSATSGKFSEIVWSPSTPTGGSDVELQFTGANFALENDIDSLTVNKLTFTANGALSGKQISLAADGDTLPVVSNSGATTNTVQNALVLGAKTRFACDNAKAQMTFNGSFSGEGQAVVDVTVSGAEVSFYGDSSSWAGGVDVFRGCLNVSDGKGLGTGTVAVTNIWKGNVVRLVSTGEAVIKGDVYLWTEDTSSAPRVSVADGHSITFDGDVYLNHSNFYNADKSTITFNGKVQGNAVTTPNVVFNGNGKGGVYNFPSGSKIKINGLYLFNSTLNVYPTDAAIGSLNFARSGLLVCQSDFVFSKSNTSFNCQNKQTGPCGLDVNGHSQNLAGVYTCSDQRGAFYLRNSDRTKVPTVRIWQTVENRTSALYAEGPMHLIKSGKSTLAITNELFCVGGTLEVEKGVLQVSCTGRVADKIIVDEGAILDLGGKTVYCGTFELNGGIVRNGTLCADETDLKAGGVLAQVSGGNDVTKTGSGKVTTSYPAAGAGATVSREGLVFCYHYDSDATLLRDAGPNDYDLVVSNWSNTAGASCDTAETRFGGGTLFLDGTGMLTPPDYGWFDKIPVGSSPYTFATHFKADSRAASRVTQGLMSYGAKEAKGSNNFLFYFSNYVLHNYWWSCDANLYKTDRSTFRDDKWHSVLQCWDGAVTRTYLDGQEVPLEYTSRLKTTVPAFKTGFVRIGNGLNQSDGSSFCGWMDETAMWSRALTAEEAFAYHRGGVPDTPTAAVGTTAFTDGTTFIADADFLEGLTNGIVCNYRFETAETLNKDSGPYGYDLVVTNANATKTITGEAPCLTTEAAHGQGAVQFKYGLMYGTETFPAKIPLGNKPYTVGFFFGNVGPYNDTYGLLTYGLNSRKKGNSFSLSANSAKINNYWWDCDIVIQLTSLASPLPTYADGYWHSFVSSWDGTTCRFWYDGIEVYMTSGSRTATTVPEYTEGIFRIGNAQNNSTLSGYMDDVTIWDRALSDDEVEYFGRYGLPESYAALPKNALLSIASGATVRPASGTLTSGGTLTLGGTVDGDLEREDGVTLKGDGTATVTGTVTVKGTGTFVTDSAPAAYPAEWDLFSAASYEGAANLGGWTIEGSNLRRHTSAFGITGNRLWASASLYGMMVIIK